MENIPIQKEFGEIDRRGKAVVIKEYGTERQVGQVTLMRYSLPVPHYLAYWLWVGRGLQGKGFGSQLLAALENISREERMPIMLHDDVDQEQNIQAVGLYARRSGWVEVKNSIPSPKGSSYIYGATGEAFTALSHSLTVKEAAAKDAAE